MLPFVFVDESKLGPFHPFGIMCALGFFLWDWAVMRQAVKKGYDRADFRVMTLWLLGMGTLFSWLVDGIFYHPAERSIPQELFSLQGWSATGGFIGATVGGLLWTRLWVGRDEGKLRARVRKTPLPALPLSEVIVSTWPLAFAVGRVGCALIHDHPGKTVAKGTLASVFALAWPRGPEDGVDHVLGPLHLVTGGADARFDLGVLEALLIGVIAIAFVFMWRREQRPGTYTMVGCLGYGAARFVLDFLRMEDGPAGDLRHAGLTFAQYWSLGVVGIGIALLLLRFRRSARRAPTPQVTG